MSSLAPLPTAPTAFEPPRPTDASRIDQTADSPAALLRRFAERFALIAFGLYHVPLFLNNYMSLGGGGVNDHGLAVQWGHVFTVPGIWIARHVFGMAHQLPSANAGDNGDVGEEFARLLLGAVVGLVAAAWWTWADRKKPSGAWAGEMLRVLLRYSIALGLASYAIAKILPMQFPPLSPLTLEQRVGDLTPMSMLWTFMETSRPYAFFGGLMECAVVALLCFRRTATLGALLCIAVMTNVTLMNWDYDVPVKLYATMTVISAAVLALYDAPRLVNVFLTNHPTRAAEEPTRLRDRIPSTWRWTIKLAVVGSVIASTLVFTIPAVGAVRDDVSQIGGTWTVSSFVNGSAAAASQASAWRRVIIGPYGFAVRTVTDSLIGCARGASGARRFTLSCRAGQAALGWRRSGDTLRLDGTFGGAPLNVTAVRSDSAYRLTSHRWQIVR